MIKAGTPKGRLRRDVRLTRSPREAFSMRAVPELYDVMRTAATTRVCRRVAW
jgi:hypothetical protein